MNKYECCICGIEGTKENQYSKCDWSMLGNHHWINSKTGKDCYGVKQ